MLNKNKKDSCGTLYSVQRYIGMNIRYSVITRKNVLLLTQNNVDESHRKLSKRVRWRWDIPYIHQSPQNCKCKIG